MYHIENEYINTPIQSIASDLTLFSLMEIYDWLVSEGYYIPYDYANSRVRIIITVHDSIVLECEDDDDLIREVAQHCQGVMRDVPAKVLPDCRVPFKADVEVGYKWGKLGEL